MPNQYTSLTRTNILRKMNRQRNPITSVLALAREYGINTAYNRHTDWYGREGKVDNRAPVSFVAKVRTLIGEENYNRLRRTESVNLMYR